MKKLIALGIVTLFCGDPLSLFLVLFFGPVIYFCVWASYIGLRGTDEQKEALYIFIMRFDDKPKPRNPAKAQAIEGLAYLCLAAWLIG